MKRQRGQEQKCNMEDGRMNQGTGEGGRRGRERGRVLKGRTARRRRRRRWRRRFKIWQPSGIGQACDETKRILADDSSSQIPRRGFSSGRSPSLTFDSLSLSLSRSSYSLRSPRSVYILEILARVPPPPPLLSQPPLRLPFGSSSSSSSYFPNRSTFSSPLLASLFLSLSLSLPFPSLIPFPTRDISLFIYLQKQLQCIFKLNSYF